MSVTVRVVPKRRAWVDVLLVWVALFGMWPFADPEHNDGSVLSVLDVALHVTAIVALGARWRVVRRGYRVEQ